MKRRLVTVLVLLIAIGNISPKAASAEDITSHWAYPALNYLINEDIMKGDSNGNYSPNRQVTRAEFATFLVRALELPAVSSTADFNDVKADAWYSYSISQASHYGLIKGDNKGNFNPNGKITRQEMAVMIKRSLDYLGISSAEVAIDFEDNSIIANWAYSDVQHVVSLNLMGGQPGNLFAPLSQATRAEAGVVLFRLINPTNTGGTGGQTTIVTEYPLDFANVNAIQAGNRPKVDGAGKFIATAPLVAYYLNPGNFSVNSPEYYQFLKLSTAVTNLDANVINEKVLFNKEMLKGKANLFIEAGLTHEINAIYLISHALHETNNGKSNLARGIEVGENTNGKPEMVTDKNRNELENIKTTYNFYGIGAIDADPNKYGAERAYSEGWFTVRDAIIGGAKFVKEQYIAPKDKYGNPLPPQDTLYKMRWNPEKPPTHQYATHVMWSIIQAKKIHEIYAITGANETTQLVFDVPKYDNQPATSPLPSPEAQYALLPAWQGGIGAINSTDGNVNLRTYPVTGISISKLPHGTKLSVLGSNGDWYRVIADGSEGWVSSAYVKLTNLLKVVDMKEYAIKSVNVRSEPNTSSSIVGSANANADVVGVIDASGNFVKDGQWFKVIVNGKTGWIRGDYIVQETTQPADGQ